MRIGLALGLCLCLLSSALQARTLMTAEEFEAFSTGQTLDYWVDGAYWGSERHLATRQTLDADAEGPCRAGAWFPKAGAICFTYEGEPAEHCWRFWRDGDRVTAEIVGSEDAFSAEVMIADQPLSCPAPDLGV
jgi:hypothetical protein